MCNGELVLKSESPNSEFAFSDDTSGVLAALGINTFFTGTTAATMGVNTVRGERSDEVRREPFRHRRRHGQRGRLAVFLDRSLETANGRSIKAFTTASSAT